MKLWVRALDQLNQHGKCVAIKLRGIHPKHLVEIPERTWYLDLLKPTDLVLDVGCGTGTNTELAATRCAYAYGIDRQEFQPRGNGVVSVAKNITDGPLPWAPAFFDAVLFFDVIEHLEERHRRYVLKEIRRVLKPDGLLFVSAPNRETSWRGRLRAAGLFSYSDPDHKVEYTKAEFLTEITSGGFDVQEVRPIVLDTPWAGLIDLIGGVNLPLYRRLARWRHQAAHRAPHESIGFLAVARRRG